MWCIMYIQTRKDVNTRPSSETAPCSARPGHESSALMPDIWLYVEITDQFLAILNVKPSLTGILAVDTSPCLERRGRLGLGVQLNTFIPRFGEMILLRNRLFTNLAMESREVDCVHSGAGLSTRSRSCNDKPARWALRGAYGLSLAKHILIFINRAYSTTVKRHTLTHRRNFTSFP